MIGVRHRPFGEAAADVLVELEAERARAGLFDRPADPEGLPCRGEERLAAIGLVEKHAVAGAAVGDLCGRGDRELLEAH